MVKRRCKICKYFSEGHGQYRTSEKAIFEHKIREGNSLRELAKYLEYALRLKISHNLIRSHITNCVPEDVRLQREAEVRVQKENKSLTKKFKKFILRHTVDLQISKCPHLNQGAFFDMDMEVCRQRCKDCGEILTGSLDPNEAGRKRQRDMRNLVILEALWK